MGLNKMKHSLKRWPPSLFWTRNRLFNTESKGQQEGSTPSPCTLRAQGRPFQDAVEFGEGMGGQLLFPAKHSGVNTSKGSFVQGSGKVQ